MSRKKVFFISLSLVVVIFAGFRILNQIKKKKNLNEQKIIYSKIIPVKVATVRYSDMENILRLTGNVHGLNEIGVYSKVPGKLYNKIKDVGDKVKRGEVIAKVDRDEPALEFALASISSPLDGVITRYLVDQGAYVMISNPVLEIADISKIKVVVFVTELNLPKINIGTPARFRIDAYPNEIFNGRVNRISESLNNVSHAAQVEIYSQNPLQKIKPGMFARVEIILETRKNVLVVPEESVIENNGNSFVYIVKEGKANKNFIKIGLRQNNLVEIDNSIKLGEKIVIVGWHNLSDKSQVEIVEQENGVAR